MTSVSGKSSRIANPINYFKEKLILQEEEKQLKKMLEKFQDQQNRLKIEELALISMMKMEKEKKERGERTHHQYATSSRTISSVTSSEMNDFAPVGVVSEDPFVINQQSLDLNLDPHSHLDRGSMDDEEELDSEEEEQHAQAVAAAESHQLMSFMEDF